MCLAPLTLLTNRQGIVCPGSAPEPAVADPKWGRGYTGGYPLPQRCFILLVSLKIPMDQTTCCQSVSHINHSGSLGDKHGVNSDLTADNEGQYR